MNESSERDRGSLRVMLAEGRPEVRSALRLLVEEGGGMTISTEAAKAEDLLKQVKDTCPDVILLDCDLPGLRVGEFLLQLRRICPRIQVVAMCGRPEMRRAALSGGADAYVCKTEPPERLLAVLRDCLKATGMAKGSASCKRDRHNQIGP